MKKKNENPIDRLKDIKTEKALLGSVIMDDGIIDAMPDLQPEDFYLARHAEIFRAALDMHNVMDEVDYLTITNELETRGKRDEVGGPAYLSELLTSMPIMSTAYGITYAKAIKRLSWLRRMFQFGVGIVNEAASDKDPEQLFAWAQAQLMQMTPARDDGSLLPGYESIEEYNRMIDEIMEAAKSGEIDRWKWPQQWKTWERFVRPMRPGQMAIITAADGVGKSAYLANIAENWAMRGNQVVLVHYEDDHEYKLHRRMARWSGIPLERLEDGTLSLEDLRKKDEANTRIMAWTDNLHYLHTPGWTMAQTLKELQRLRNDGLCDIAVIDYLDKARPDRRQMKLFGHNVWERQADDAEQLKAWGERNNTPILTATQGNKGMQRPGLKTRADIQGSGQKSQKSQLVIILSRDILESPQMMDDGTMLSEGDYSPIVNVRIDKQNRGKKLTFQQFFDGPRYRIIDAETKKF